MMCIGNTHPSPRNNAGGGIQTEVIMNKPSEQNTTNISENITVQNWKSGPNKGHEQKLASLVQERYAITRDKANKLFSRSGTAGDQHYTEILR